LTLFTNATNRTRWVTLMVLGLLAAGCGNPYRKNYLSTLDQWPGKSARLLPLSGEPRLLSSTDVKSDSIAMLENGYLMVGHAAFRGARIDEKQALEQARSVGAAAVMVDKRFVNTVSESIPMNEWIPDRIIGTTERVVVTDGSETPKVVQKDSTTVIQGEFRTHYVQQNVDYYDYEATFWAKAAPPAFGVFVRELDDAAKAAIQSNKGVIVKAVVKDSPAFDADLLKGDVLVSLGGEPIRHPQGFFELLRQNKGKTVQVQLMRAGVKKTLKVSLNP